MIDVASLEKGDLVIWPRTGWNWLIVEKGQTKFNGVPGPYLFRVYRCDQGRGHWPDGLHSLVDMGGGKLQSYLDKGKDEIRIVRANPAPCTCSTILPWDSNFCPRHG